MRDGIEGIEMELVIRADVNVRATVLSLVAVLGRREDLNQVSKGDESGMKALTYR